MDVIKRCSRPRYQKAQARVQVRRRAEGHRRDVDERTRRDLDEFDDE